MSSTTFTCTVCHIAKTHTDPHTTGYGTRDNGDKVCFECCGKEDAESLRTEGKGMMYLSNDKLTNWPGTLKITVDRVKSSFHNFAGHNGRRDVWFSWEGAKWHGVSIGDSGICRIKRCK